MHESDFRIKLTINKDGHDVEIEFDGDPDEPISFPGVKKEVRRSTLASWIRDTIYHHIFTSIHSQKNREQ